MVLVLLVIIIAIFAPLFIPPEYATRMDMRARLSPPDLNHWLGTDQLGRDLFYRVMLGARTSIYIAASAVLMSLIIGLPLGLISGYFGENLRVFWSFSRYPNQRRFVFLF